jgi:hypothetical protein
VLGDQVNDLRSFVTITYFIRVHVVSPVFFEILSTRSTHRGRFFVVACGSIGQTKVLVACYIQKGEALFNHTTFI